MARTLTAQTAVRVVAARFPRLDQSDVAARLCDEVQAAIWHRYPWRQSLAELPPFHLLAEEPDYGPPVYAVPSDFYGLHRVWVRTSSNMVYPLTVRNGLALSIATDVPTEISYQPETSSFRVHPRPSVTAPDYWVEGAYKKNPTKITNSNITSYILPWDDIYFGVFRKGLIWKVKEDLLGDPAADNDLAKFFYLVDEMARAEGLHLGVDQMAPAESLELGGL